MYAKQQKISDKVENTKSQKSLKSKSWSVIENLREEAHRKGQMAQMMKSPLLVVNHSK